MLMSTGIGHWEINISQRQPPTLLNGLRPPFLFLGARWDERLARWGLMRALWPYLLQAALMQFSCWSRAARAAFLRYTRVTNVQFHLPPDTESAPSPCCTSRAAITSVLQGWQGSSSAERGDCLNGTSYTRGLVTVRNIGRELVSSTCFHT